MAQAERKVVAAAETDHISDLPRSIRTSARLSASDLGHADGLRHAVLTLVGDEQYERAQKRLREFAQLKAAYPKFEARAERYINYANDLIFSIKAKRSFPGIEKLAPSKQQDLHDRAFEHLRDLLATLKKIEQIDREVRAEDVRSTVWVIKALVYGTFAVLIFAFLLEVSQGLIPSATIVVDDALNSVTNWLFDKLNL